MHPWGPKHSGLVVVVAPFRIKGLRLVTVQLPENSWPIGPGVVKRCSILTMPGGSPVNVQITPRLYDRPHKKMEGTKRGFLSIHLCSRRHNTSSCEVVVR